MCSWHSLGPWVSITAVFVQRPKFLKSSHQPHRGQREPGSRSFYLEMIEITPGHNFLAKVKKTPKLNFNGVKEWKVDTAQLLALPQFFIRMVIYRLT